MTLLTSNMYNIFYFCGSLTGSSQCCQITTIRYSKFEFESAKFFLYTLYRVSQKSGTIKKLVMYSLQILCHFE